MNRLAHPSDGVLSLQVDTVCPLNVPKKTDRPMPQLVHGDGEHAATHDDGEP